MKNTTNYEGPECCRMCMNNPANNPNASGFCNCALPYMELSGEGTAVPSTSTIRYGVTRPAITTGTNT